ncbi:DPP IV N-terminal domain-containing protein [Sphingomonas sp. MMSM20]|uniref:S9 family peptidase n=1 Tax=Sphingomonas lycopersici TaxID=2951807 RepID=UPI002237C68A|nr:DPP IV N-terminal domain-containing protein [Sphingomonas lycopersici]
MIGHQIFRFRPCLTAGFAIGLVCGSAGVIAQPAADDEARLNRALAFTSGRLLKKVRNHAIKIHWIGAGERFWFRHELTQGNEYLLVDAATGNRRPAFDHHALATALGKATGGTLEADKLELTSLEFSGDPRRLTVGLEEARFRCDLEKILCARSADTEPGADRIVSPDGSSIIFRRDYNLWLRTLATGQERQLTHDGIKDFAYGDTDAYIDEAKVATRRARAPAPLLGVHWSPDGRRILALRQDLRAVPARLVLTEYLPPDRTDPVMHVRHAAVPNDPQRAASAMTIVDVRTGAATPVQIDPQSMNDWALPYFTLGGFIRWDEAGDAFIIGANRGGTRYRLSKIDIKTGAVRDVVTEEGRFSLRLNPYDYARPNVHVLKNGREAIWYSERDGWGHLYLYDVATGKVKRQLTEGAWVVADLVRIDEAHRQVYFTATGRERGRNLYYRHLYRVALDGGTPELLTPEDADHEFDADQDFWEGPRPGSDFSPDGRYFVDSFSTATTPARYVIRAASGKLVGQLAEADDSALRASGWAPPEQFVTKAADGATDLYGVIYKPRDFDPTKKYPVIEQTYPGPQGKFAPTTFRGYFDYMQPSATAELGFIVVYLDGRGTAYRSREFRDTFRGTDDPFGSADHAAALRNLGKTRPYLDLERVGIVGQSFGGYGSLRAMLLHPDLYKACVSSVGPGEWIDFPGDTSNERFFGVPGQSKQARDYFDLISNVRLADRLKGNLLLIYGGIDEIVPMRSGFKLIDALVRANKQFDLLLVPDSPHHVGAEPYGVERGMRFFMDHLGGPMPTSSRKQEP